MTRYLCAHPGHERKGRARAVDVTAQVRLEREFLPRESAYLASTDDVIARVAALRTGDPVDRLAQVRRVLTGTMAPIDAPVVLAASATDRVPGLYELDELRRSDPAIERLIDRRFQATPGADDVVVLSDAEPRPTTGVASPTTETLTATQLEQVQRARVLPQGLFPVMELGTHRRRAAHRRGDRRGDQGHPDGGDAARRADRSVARSDRVPESGRSPAREPSRDLHRHRRPRARRGARHPAVGWDVAIEDAASVDLAPPTPSRRAERRLKAVLIAELVVAALVAGFAWASGALAHAVRETPGWLGFAATIGVAAVAIGLIGLLGRSDADGNANDTFVLRRHYASRTQMLATSTMLSAGIFALRWRRRSCRRFSTEPPVPAPAITFAAGNRVVTATVQVDGATSRPTTS